MTKLAKTKDRKAKLNIKLEKFFEENYFDVQGVNPAFSNIDEAYLGRVLTKLAVGSATVWWSLIEIKDFINMRNRVRTKAGFYASPRTNPFREN